jgi:hypothetical protein
VEGKLIVTPGGSKARPFDSSVPSLKNADDFIIIRPQGLNDARTSPPPPIPSENWKKDRVLPSSPSGTGPSPSLPAADKPGKLPQAAPSGFEPFDYWFVVAIEGQRAGYVHWSAQLQPHKDKQFLIGTRYMRLTVSRFGQLVTQWNEESTVETPEGTVLVVSMRQGLGKDQALALSGTVEERTLKVRGEGAAAGATDTPWPAGVVGFAREVQLFRALQLQPGESHRYLSYVPTVNRVVAITLTFQGEETRALWPNTPPRRLLRFRSKPEPLGKVRLPASTTWVDAHSREPLLVECEFPAWGGRLTFLRTTQEAATAPIHRPVEVFAFQSIRLDRPITRPHELSEVVFRVQVPDEDEPETLFAVDNRQQIKNHDPATKTFELHVHARHGPVKGIHEPAPGQEYLESNFFLNWDNAAVKRLATQATAALAPDADAWSKARAVERWVHQNMKAFELSQALATADQVAQNLTGDCTEYAMLAAAMCRALGIPSRTAMGLVYAPATDGQPTLAYHMWFEVYAAGQWLPLDATRGQGGVGPTHIKITHDSWHQERSFAPLLPVLRMLSARPRFEVLRTRP